MQWLVVHACDWLYLDSSRTAVDNKNIARSLQGPKVQVAVESFKVRGGRLSEGPS